MRPLNTFQKGVASVELAIILPFLILILLGGIDLARTIYQYNTLVKNVRDASKYLAAHVRPKDYLTNAEYINTVKEAEYLAVCGSISACSTASAPGLTTKNIEITYPDEVAGVTFVKVGITKYSLTLLFDILGTSKSFSEIQLTMYQLQQT